MRVRWTTKAADDLAHIVEYIRKLHLPNAVIERIKAAEIEGSIPLPPVTVSPFILGEEVRVSDGPFSGFNGIVDLVLDATLDSDIRIRLLVDLFGRACPVTLDIDQLEKL